MKKKQIDFKNFEIIKEGAKQIKGGTQEAVSEVCRDTYPPSPLPVACDNVS